MKHIRALSACRVAVLAAALSAAGPAGSAEQAPPQPPVTPPIVFENLQVFPKDIKPEQLLDQMHGFADALGVGCDYCHAAGKPPAWAPPGETLQFSLDTNPKKKIARQMLVMLGTINAMVPVAVGKAPEQAVHLQCYNCHRGMVTPPLSLAATLDRTTAEKGRDAAVAQFKELRQKYFGSAAYDFADFRQDGPNVSLGGLNAYGLTLATTGKPDDALVWLNLNLEYFPNSAVTWALVANAQLLKGNKPAALEAINKAIDLAKPLFGGTLPSGNPLEPLLAQIKALP